MPSFLLANAEVAALLGADAPEFPKYVAQILNLANHTAQGTRPGVVGQLSEVMAQFVRRGGQSLPEWQDFYNAHYPDSIETATDRVYRMVELLREAIQHIDRPMVAQWVNDLIVHKTYTGLRFQQAILRRVAQLKGLEYRPATPADESIGIDGYIGTVPVSIKPDTYDAKATILPEHIGARIITYRKQADGLRIRFDF